MSESTNPIPYEGKENYIFVSYSHMDMDRVMPVVRQWMENGYRVWYDDGISPGTVIGIPRQRWNTNK
ncbi:MAG: toll/interleukin-1 receptor domain-containing protein [Lachnospiraceae bacterium]|nr:toll/interleukin-1 receptor domain-containing protein [Lachnospiraceae bacterium]